MEDLLFGDFDHVPAAIVPEGRVQIIVQPIDLMTYWRRCGLLANFSAAFCSYQSGDSSASEDLVSTVFNELIENAAKFSKKRDATVVIDVRRYFKIIKIEVRNTSDARVAERFTRFLEDLRGQGDLEAHYFAKLAAKQDGDTESGIGLLMLLKDYPVKLGVKVARTGERDAEITVQVYCMLNEGAS